MLKLKLLYFGHLMWRAGSLEKTLMPGNIEGRRRRGPFLEMVGWHHRLNGPESEQAPGDGEGQGSLAGCSPRGCSTGLQRVGHDWTTTATKPVSDVAVVLRAQELDAVIFRHTSVLYCVLFPHRLLQYVRWSHLCTSLSFLIIYLIDVSVRMLIPSTSFISFL